LFPRNLNSQKVSGLDFQADYQMPLGRGGLSTRLTGSYLINQSQVALGVLTKYDGALGVDSPVQGVPKFRATLIETYSQGPASLTAQLRFIGSAKLVDSWGPKDVDDNSIPAIGYLDLRGSVQVQSSVELFAAVDNLLNQDPPNVAVSQNAAASIFSTPVRGDIYDLLGRSYRVGVRLKF
jgi:iron complex outermembrane receptor protein